MGMSVGSEDDEEMIGTINTTPPVSYTHLTLPTTNL
ncbi:hypothetical protein ACN6QZ_16575, partial [Acinetobacter baumannii]